MYARKKIPRSIKTKVCFQQKIYSEWCLVGHFVEYQSTGREVSTGCQYQNYILEVMIHTIILFEMI